MLPMEEEVRRAAQSLFRTEQGAQAWLTLRNKRLGATPMALLKEGRGAEVMAELRLVREQVGPDITPPTVASWLSRLLGFGPRK